MKFVPLTEPLIREFVDRLTASVENLERALYEALIVYECRLSQERLLVAMEAVETAKATIIGGAETVYVGPKRVGDGAK